MVGHAYATALNEARDLRAGGMQRVGGHGSNHVVLFGRAELLVGAAKGHQPTLAVFPFRGSRGVCDGQAGSCRIHALNGPSGNSARSNA